MFRLIVVAALLAALILVVAALSDPLTAWASAQQRSLQSELAGALSAVRSGDVVAVATTIGVCALYGVVHAVGPGHGKLLIGGAALASQRTAARMARLGLAASLAQGVTAILLVYGGLGLFSVASRSLIGLSETWLTAASYLAIAGVGGWMLWRGARLVRRLTRSPTATASRGDRHHHHRDHDHEHGDACHAGCRHAPTAREVDGVESWRDAMVLIASIGIRPCSGAMIVLALSWRFETYAVGAASTFAMALGTGLVVATVALTAVRLRDAGGLGGAGPVGLWSAAAALLCVGALIIAISLSLAASAVSESGRSHPLTGASSQGSTFTFERSIA